MQYLFTPPNKRRSFCGAQIRTLHIKKTGHTFFVCPTSKVLASQRLNLMTLPYEPLERFCKEQELTILARIPYDSKVAAFVADGQIVSKYSEEMRQLFEKMLRQIGGAR